MSDTVISKSALRAMEEVETRLENRESIDSVSLLADVPLWEHELVRQAVYLLMFCRGMKRRISATHEAVVDMFGEPPDFGEQYEDR